MDTLGSRYWLLHSFYLSSLIFFHLRPCKALPIDNEVLGSSVVCGSDSITVNFETRNPYEGRIFVKGMIDNSGCLNNYADSPDQSVNPTITFTFGDCNMQRARTLAPLRGMMQSIVVIISFHKMFITKVDKAYKVQCFYMEAEKTVTSQLEVSMLTTDDLRDTGRMPTCTYTVRRNSRDGPIVRYARIGEPVFHEWTCDSDTHDMLVKECFVDDGQGNKFEIIDEVGCAVDPVIMPDLQYENGQVAVAHAESHVFKFADKPTVFFQCTVQLCNRGAPDCSAITPPNCRSFSFTRFRREVPVIGNQGPSVIGSVSNDELDLLSDTISVLDLEDSLKTNQPRRVENKQIPFFISSGPALTELGAATEGGVCMSATGFGLLITMVIMVFIVATVVSGFLCFGRPLLKADKCSIPRNYS